MSRKVFSPHPFTGGDAPDYWFLGRADDSFIKELGIPFRISQASDRSGKGITIAQSIPVQRPTWDGVINGYTVPRFNAIGGLFVNSAPFPIESDYTFMIVAFSALINEETIVAQWQIEGSLFDIYATSSGRFVFRYNDGLQDVFHATDIASVTANIPFLGTVIMKNGVSQGIIRLDGVEKLSGLSFTPARTGVSFYVGTILNLPAFTLTGSIAEILIWKKALESHKVLWYERYLRNYYAL